MKNKSKHLIKPSVDVKKLLRAGLLTLNIAFAMHGLQQNPKSIKDKAKIKKLLNTIKKHNNYIYNVSKTLDKISNKLKSQ